MLKEKNLDEKKILQLIEGGYDFINQEDHKSDIPALYWAVRRNSVNIVRALIENGASV